MSDFTIDDIGRLQQYADVIDDLLAWFQPDSSGGSAAVPDTLVPAAGASSPNIGQQPMSGSGFGGFNDAINLFLSYDSARRNLVGDPGQFASAPASSSLAAFVDGLRHLHATATSIIANYDSAQRDDKLSVDQIKAQLNAPLSSSVPATG